MRWRTWLAAGAIATAALAGCSDTAAARWRFALRRVSETALTGGPVRFDYTALDVERGRLFIAHMGASELIDVDVGARTVVRTLPDLPDVHGVIVVPDKHRVYATATGNNQLVAIDEDSDRVAFRSSDRHLSRRPCLRPDPARCLDNQSGAGTETVVDADTGTVRATVPLGGEVGNVVYDGLPDKMVVAVQGRNELAVIDPVSFTVTERIPTAGCDHPHGQALDGAESGDVCGLRSQRHDGHRRFVRSEPWLTATVSAKLPMCWPTTLAPGVSMSPPRAAGSAFSITNTGV